jgi:hypothetical protein
MTKAVSSPHHPTSCHSFTVSVIENGAPLILAVFDECCKTSGIDDFTLTNLIVVNMVKPHTNDIQV